MYEKVGFDSPKRHPKKIFLFIFAFEKLEKFIPNHHRDRAESTARYTVC